MNEQWDPHTPVPRKEKISFVILKKVKEAMGDSYEINQCPRCGSDGWIVIGEGYYFVTCRRIGGKGCGLASFGRPTQFKAIEQWNRLKDDAQKIPERPGAYVNSAGITAADDPATVVRKLDAAFARLKGFMVEGDGVPENWHEYWD